VKFADMVGFIFAGENRANQPGYLEPTGSSYKNQKNHSWNWLRNPMVAPKALQQLVLHGKSALCKLLG